MGSHGRGRQQHEGAPSRPSSLHESCIHHLVSACETDAWTPVARPRCSESITETHRKPSTESSAAIDAFYSLFLGSFMHLSHRFADSSDLSHIINRNTLCSWSELIGTFINQFNIISSICKTFTISSDLCFLLNVEEAGELGFVE